ncbi:MAG: hypothetical protein QNK11_06585 [Legionella sp.]|nr:hypothetical protein [Legionella sp.]
MSTSNQGAIKVAPLYFQQIRAGLKTVEGRIAKEKFCALREGQVLEFLSENDSLFTRVLELKQFPTFKDMLEHYGLKTCLPDIDCLEEGVKIYHSFPNYKQNESKFGVIGIKIELLDKI